MFDVRLFILAPDFCLILSPASLEFTEAQMDLISEREIKRKH